jgi:hypothetical protein
MIDTNRRTVTKHMYINARFLIETTVRETIVALQALEAEGWVGMDYDNDDDGDVTFTQTRLETDEEYNYRINAETQWAKCAEKQKQLEKERERRYQDYLKLKEEFGND